MLLVVTQLSRDVIARNVIGAFRSSILNLHVRENYNKLKKNFLSFGRAAYGLCHRLERCKSYLSCRIRCGWSRDLMCFGLPRGLRDHRCYRLWQGPGRCVFKFESPFAGIKKMPHSLLVNRSVFFIPREYKALPSVQILFTKLRSHLPFCPARDDRPRFFVFILVVTVSAYHDQHFVT